MIIADDDGVVVVPQEIADEVARRAKLVQDKDRPGRRRGYEAARHPAGRDRPVAAADHPGGCLVGPSSISIRQTQGAAR